MILEERAKKGIPEPAPSKKTEPPAEKPSKNTPSEPPAAKAGAAHDPYDYPTTLRKGLFWNTVVIDVPLTKEQAENVKRLTEGTPAERIQGTTGIEKQPDGSYRIVLSERQAESNRIDIGNAFIELGIRPPIVVNTSRQDQETELAEHKGAEVDRALGLSTQERQKELTEKIAKLKGMPEGHEKDLLWGTIDALKFANTVVATAQESETERASEDKRLAKLLEESPTVANNSPKKPNADQPQNSLNQVLELVLNNFLGEQGTKLLTDFLVVNGGIDVNNAKIVTSNNSGVNPDINKETGRVV